MDRTNYGSTKQERYSSSHGIVEVGDSKKSLVYLSATIVQRIPVLSCALHYFYQLQKKCTLQLFVERERATLMNKFIEERMGCSKFLPISSRELENAGLIFTNKP